MAPKRTSVSGKGGAGGDDRVHVIVRIRPPVRKDEKFGEGSEALQCKGLRFLHSAALPRVASPCVQGAGPS